ncbi:MULTISPECIES: DISARM system SNF2-like helicase DrmD [Sphingomonas]|jgi:superfamily II DNA or RNA helicase|uniref:DEAD/DEAH box helicase n=1 Tax=Sphingomonas zeae TaxID=1646122 RepID=A0A7Y6B818_9SPHN|nr:MULTISPECIES: DISARM system SNF2-like helicase DrmD [Sphingomonas]MBB4049482.1 superfamily II DNA or RNA helicase [Sphingomonas zeae]MDK8186788.1 DISARM system SNF2-like helicase DrmD [Sphingomonas zeae]MDK8216452.1 DISARM system SNF2-like helicase DrmD [Sphingomonas sp. UMB7805-LC452B]NUU48226.1 DEAD/DEAH box helicase [Sphingomonas zeae]
MPETAGFATSSPRASGPAVGQFVSLRGRLWMVEAQPDGPLSGHRLACIDDDASGEDAQVLWSAEVDARLHDEEAWASLGTQGGDAATFSAYLRTVRWRTATAAERDLFQAPFRAGIRLDPYQLLPLRKALRLPRVNLLIADDVGLGKTVEAGLVLRELLLRRRVDYTVVIAPAAMTGQWREELQSKFGLAFEIVDARHLEELRRRRGYGANPWAAGSRFILSHRLLGEEAYVAGLRHVLEDFRARSLLILDEAHHAAPAGGGRYAIESQFTRSLRDLSDRFEHRLFLSATPHNGHPNSFATLLELLDPQRFTRGVTVRPADLEPVMVRRLKSDLRALGEAFPERIVAPVVLDNLPEDAPELVLAAMLADYRRLRERRIGGLAGAQAARARLAMVGLQQRLLSSIPAFARTLRVHIAGLDRAIAGTMREAPPVEVEAPERAEDEDAALALLDRAVEAEAERQAATGAAGGSPDQLAEERRAAAAMLGVADAARTQPDARVGWILDWARTNLLDAGGNWRERRLILFTEYEDTRRWLQRQLAVLLDPEDAQEARRIDSFTGITSTERREAIKRAFNDPADPLRILICTDAAREGINLQARCHDLIHVDLPWNPSRLEQRNGRIDRKLQPSPTVTCRYFVYAQRPEDVVLDALVRKTELIRRQLGSAGQVLGARIADRLGGGIDRAAARDLAARIDDEEADERVRAAVRDLDDGAEARLARLKREQADLAKALETARARVGVDPDELQSVVGLALNRAGGAWGPPAAIGETPVFALDQATLANDPSWQPLLDELRARPIRSGERPGEWRASPDADLRRISFAPAILPDGRDAGDVVQLHLEHRLVRRLLGRFLSAGFRQGLERACVIRTAATPAPRVILLGRLALYGEQAARLHEEVLSVAADWRDSGGLRALAEGRDAEARVLEELIEALRHATDAEPAIAAQATAHAMRDVTELRPVLEARAAARAEKVAGELTRRAESEARGLETLLRQRIARLLRERGDDDGQLSLLLDPMEARQRAADRRSWDRATTRLDDEMIREPERLRAGSRIHATRLEPIGLVYLWPLA